VTSSRSGGIEGFEQHASCTLGAAPCLSRLCGRRRGSFESMLRVGAKERYFCRYLLLQFGKSLR
jgi:hypothetical protein